MKWQKDGDTYEVVYKNYTCKIRPFGTGQFIGHISLEPGFSYQTGPLETVEAACKRCLEVVDAR